LIILSKVSLRYGSNADVLKNITFKLDSGSFNFLTGASGSGKSSLLKLLYLGHLPSSGELNIFGKNIAKIPKYELPMLRRKIGVVFQDFRLMEHLTVIENVALPLQIAGARSEDVREHVNELISWVGLDDKIDLYPSTLSDGEKQRIAIARAVIGRPRLLLADEPTGSIDHEQGTKIMYLFKELNKIGTTVIIATHDDSLVREYKYPKLNLLNGKVFSRDSK